MIWFMEEANFIKWMELSSKDCGKIINWFRNFEQFSSTFLISSTSKFFCLIILSFLYFLIFLHYKKIK